MFLPTRWIAGIASSVLASVPAAALADEIVVPTDHTLSVALTLAVSGDIITILPGTYEQVPGFAFSNKQITVRGSTGNPADVVLSGANLDIVLRISGAMAAGSLIQDLTIRNGRGGTATDSQGGGVHLSAGANVTFRNCVIRDNTIPAVDGNGAGIYATACSLRIEGCLLENNTIPSGVADGGGIYFNTGSHVIIDTVFRNNGVATGTPFVSGSIGGGFYADGGTAQFTRCVFQGNRSYWGGGIGVAGNMVVTIDESVAADNVANNGGGFFITNAAGGGTPRIRNTLFVGNTGVNDAAIYTDKGGAFTNLTIVANTASGSYVIGGSTASAIDNCIFWGNTYNTTNGLFPANTPDVVRRCILQQAYAGAGGSGFNQVIDPLFVDFGARDFHLGDLSPAIDAGDSNLYFGPFADLDGNARGVDVPEVTDTGSSISGPVIDIGAYEFQTDPPLPDCPGDFNRDGILNSQDFFDYLTAFFAGC